MPLPNDSVPPPRQTVRRLKRAGVAGLVIAGAVIANGVLVRRDASSEQTELASEQSVPNVSILHPSRRKSDTTLTLPGALQAYYSAPIYARVPGYVRMWFKDIGAQLHRGDILAEIDTPELDQQITQAQADLANAEAAQRVSASTAARWSKLLAIGGVSAQDEEEKAGDLAAKNALTDSAKANLDRLQALKVFAHITAPFDGVVTERATDIGALVNAGAGSAGSQLFTIADIHKLRVYVRVPQNYSTQIHDHMTAQLNLPEYPGMTFPAHLVSTSNAISDQSNTLLVEFEADNAQGKLKPGAYAQVSMSLPVADSALNVPVSVLMFRGNGLQVATVGENNRVIMKPIIIANDLGTEVEVSSGLNPEDNVIDNPPDSLAAGEKVHVTTSKPLQSIAVKK